MFFGLVGGNKKPETAAPAVTAQTVDATATTTSTQTTATIDSTPQTTTTENKSPLDQFKGLWETPPADPNKQPEPDLFAVDPDKLNQAASKLDFARVIKPEQLAAISQGGEQAVQAFAAAMNAVSQATWQSSFATSQKMMQEVFARKEQEFDARIQGALRNHGIDAALSSNPVFNHPAAKPVVGAIARAMSVKFPEATPQELQAKAAELLAEIAGGTKTSNKVKQEASENKDSYTDWDTWLAQ